MAWRPLHVSAAAGAHLPPLLISADFTNDSYTIYLSDLTSIWSESLSRKDIIERSREESTSIDPSSRDQFQIFRDKIRLGLEGGSDTALSLTVKADPSRPSLILNVSVDLPGGLAPLEWAFRLVAASPSVFASQLVTPLLQAQHRRIREVSGLADLLREKDHVIQKLLDKLEGGGMDLGQVFPQVANKVGRKVDRKKAAERVKGLGPFDMGGWREGLDQEESRSTTQLIDEVLGERADTPIVRVENQNQADAEEWWEGIKGITVDLETGKISTKGPARGARRTTPLPKSKPPPVIPVHESIIDEDDDAFQVQATPPRSSAISPAKAAEDTTDDDDLDAPSQISTQRSKIPDSYPRSPPPAKEPSPKPTKKQFGKLPSKKAAPPPPPPAEDNESTDDDDDEPIPPPRSRRTASPVASGTEDETTSPPPKANTTPKPPATKGKGFGKIQSKKKAPVPPAPSETEDEPEAAEADPSPPPKVPLPKPQKGKFGRLKGKRKIAETTPAPEEDVEKPAATNISPTPKRGRFGKLPQHSPTKKVKDESSSQTAGEEVPTRGRASAVPEEEATPPARETSEERAERRQKELQKELEAKAKAPAKKKRKF